MIIGFKKNNSRIILLKNSSSHGCSFALIVLKKRANSFYYYRVIYVNKCNLIFYVRSVSNFYWIGTNVMIKSGMIYDNLTDKYINR